MNNHFNSPKTKRTEDIIDFLVIAKSNKLTEEELNDPKEYCSKFC